MIYIIFGIIHSTFVDLPERSEYSVRGRVYKLDEIAVITTLENAK
jgi:hypothetical protein